MPDDEHENEHEVEIDPEKFDADRAARTIAAQRESERKAKERAAALAAELEQARAQEATRLEAERALQARLAEAEARAEQATRGFEEFKAEAEFKAAASDAGLDPELAFLAAKKDGLVGTINSETGRLEGYDLDALREAYPALVKDRSGKPKPGGDAGVRAKGDSRTVGDKFNEAIRDAFR